MPNSIDAMADKMVANMKEKTGKTLEQWLKLTAKLKFEKHMELVKYLKSEHGVTHGFANMIAHYAFKPSTENETPDLVDAQYAGPKSAIRPLYDALVKVLQGFGGDVDLAPKKAYVSVRRKKQFAILQPSTKDRLDVGINLKSINLKGQKAAERLEASGSFNAMVSHRVRVTKKSDINAELKQWLKAAYEAAG